MKADFLYYKSGGLWQSGKFNAEAYKKRLANAYLRFEAAHGANHWRLTEWRHMIFVALSGTGANFDAELEEIDRQRKIRTTRTA